MNRKKIFVVLILIGITGIIIFLVLSNNTNPEKGRKKETSQNEEADSLTIKEKYQVSLKKAQQKVDFPVEYPKNLPKGYVFSKINAWSGNTKGVYIYYKKDKEGEFIMEETNAQPFSSYLGKPQELYLANKEKAYFWEIENQKGKITYLLYFGKIKKRNETIFYSISSSSLSKKEMISIANSVASVEN